MRDDFFYEIIQFSHFILEGSVTPVTAYMAATEALVHQVQYFASIIILTNTKTWFYFPPNKKLRPF